MSRKKRGSRGYRRREEIAPVFHARVQCLVCSWEGPRRSSQDRQAVTTRLGTDSAGHGQESGHAVTSEHWWAGRCEPCQLSGPRYRQKSEAADWLRTHLTTAPQHEDYVTRRHIRGAAEGI